MNNTSNSLVSGIDPASFSAVTGPSQDLFRFVNGPWVDMYRLPDDRSRYGSFDKLAEDAENQIRDILEEDDCPAVKSRALYHSFLDVDAIDAANTSYTFAALGDYEFRITATRFDGNGLEEEQTLSYYAFVGLDAAESDLYPSGGTVAAVALPDGIVTKSEPMEIWLYLLIALLVILTAEWWVYYRV